MSMLTGAARPLGTEIMIIKIGKQKMYLLLDIFYKNYYSIPEK
jgi:hypothetical protein